MKTKEEAAQLKSGDIVVLNDIASFGLNSEKEVMRFILIESTKGWLKAVILYNPDIPEGSSNWPGSTWDFRRAKLIGKNWRVL